MSERVNSQYQSLLADRDLVEEIRKKAAEGRLHMAARFGLSGDAIERALASDAARPAAAEMPARRTMAGLGAPRPDAPRPGADPQEAIVLLTGRPSLIVQNGTYQVPDSEIWREELELARSAIEFAIARTGRIELFNHETFDWVGTGWLIGPRQIITNRHVAVEFATSDANGGFAFRTNFLDRPISARIDFREEFEIDAALEVAVEKIIYVAEPDEPDIAILEVAGDTELPEPLELLDGGPGQRQTVGVVGYPAFDTRNGRDAMREIFGDVYDVKRFAPGRVSFPEDGEPWFVHDCTTLGGASGSPVIDLDSGRVAGLHFSGRFREGNFAVKTEFIKQALTRSSVSVVTPPPPRDGEAIADGRHAPAFFAGRDGYQSGFLGAEVALPDLGGWRDDAQEVEGGGRELAYRHFSVVMSKSRKLPILTAVNIDGRQARRVFRNDDKWFIDQRILGEDQLGNELYVGNDLDRGHMVRRLDPVWGTQKEAEEANEDTFHYANSAPQHMDLNRRVWNDLEDYLLDAATAKDLKMSVFTGPVLREDDRQYRDLVRLPREFWKVAVIVDVRNDELLAAGYVLSQGDMIRDITETPFVFGEFRTFQVLISSIAEATQLDFGALVAQDALHRARGEREVPPPRAIRINGARDLVL